MKKERLMIAISQLNTTLLNTIGQDIYQYGITPTEFRILAHLKSAGKTKTQKIGEIAFITSGAITYMLKKLKAKKYILTYKDSKDKRITWVELSKEGKAFYQDMYPKHLKYVDEVFEVFSDDELELLQAHIKKFDKKLRRK